MSESQEAARTIDMARGSLIGLLRFLADFNERNDVDSEMTQQEWRQLCRAMTRAADVLEQVLLTYAAHAQDCPRYEWKQPCRCGLDQLRHECL